MRFMRIFERGNRKEIKILQQQISDLKKQMDVSTHFIKEIANGNLEVELSKDLSDEQGELISSLVHMRDKMKEYSTKESERIWIAEGMARFVNILRSDDNNKDVFYQNIISNVVKYLNANQGGIFMAYEESNGEEMLELVSCYAYERKRFLEKKISVKEGLAGQCYIEKEVIYMTDLPQSYTRITSGLGEATPGCLLITPLKFNDQVVGVLEIVSFYQIEEYKIEFVKKLCESIGSVSINIKNAELAQELLKDSEIKASILQEQEEEMRQNLEELVATQEEMQRKQMEVDQKGSIMQLIVDNIPFPVFVKDNQGKYILVNKAEAQLFSLPESEIIGKDDSYFVQNEEEWKVIQESDRNTINSMKPMELPMQHFTLPNGKSYVFKTTKIPFLNEFSKETNILGVSVDLTDRVELEQQLNEIRNHKNSSSQKD